jgi:acyl carrier protein
MQAPNTFGRLQGLLADKFGKAPALITQDATLRGTLMLDSLDLEDLAFFVQREFSVVIDPETYRRARSLEGLVQLIERGATRAA